MQRQRRDGGGEELPLFEEIKTSRRNVLKASLGLAASLLSGRGLSAAQTAQPQTAQGNIPAQGIFNGVCTLDGGGELVMFTLPSGSVRGSKDGGRTQIEGRAGDNRLAYRWWTPKQFGTGYDQAPPAERGTGVVEFKPAGELTGAERTDGTSASKTWSARKRPGKGFILSANRPFIGGWTNGRDFLGIHQRYDGSPGGVLISANGEMTLLNGFTQEGRMEYRLRIPRQPEEKNMRIPRYPEGSGLIVIGEDGRLRNEWTLDGDKARGTGTFERVKTRGGREGAAVQELDDVSLLRFLRDNPDAVVDFWATWCGPCVKTAPLFKQLAGQNPGIAFGKVNVDVGWRAQRVFGVSVIPQVIFFKNGVEVYRHVGANPDGMANSITTFRDRWEL